MQVAHLSCGCKGFDENFGVSALTARVCHCLCDYDSASFWSLARSSLNFVDVLSSCFGKVDCMACC